jgi:hypothetical protein
MAAPTAAAVATDRDLAAAPPAEDAADIVVDAPSASPSNPVLRTRSDFRYRSCYCEENTYLLLKCLIEVGNDPDSLYAVFVSNQQRCVPIWRQRSAAARPGDDGGQQLAAWDYHVFAVQRDSPAAEEDSLVYDLDTTLEPFPCTFEQYRREALRDPRHAGFPLRRLYRVVPARELFARFSSDRSHMRTPQGGWTMPPPSWPPLGAELADKNTLPLFLDMRAEGEAGAPSPLGPEVLLLDEGAFFAEFSASSSSHRRREATEAAV